MQKRIDDCFRLLDSKIPFSSACDWDNVGLLIGNHQDLTSGVVLSLDLTLQAVQKAIEKNASLIVIHHPCLFPKNPLSEIRSDHPIAVALQHQKSVICCHSNFDAHEVSAEMIRLLGLKLLGRFSDALSFFQFECYVPESHFDQVFDAASQAGAGRFSDYDHCGFSVQGEGRFRPLDSANPFLGQKQVVSSVAEKKLEMLVAQGLQQKVLSAVRQVHPYEQIAYQFVSVQTDSGASGFGFWGSYSEPLSFDLFADKVKNTFKVKTFRLTGEKKPIRLVGFMPGSGKQALKEALRRGCDVFITGEIDYHTAVFACMKGCLVVELGHTQSEVFFYPVLSAWFQEWGLSSYWVDGHRQELI